MRALSTISLSPVNYRWEYPPKLNFVLKVAQIYLVAQLKVGFVYGR